MSEKMEFRAHDIVLEYIQRHLDKSDDVPNIEIYTVWKCKILQNWKFLISSSLLDGMYYELTFNGDKNEWYLDAYKKFENQVIREDTVNAPQTKRYDYSKSVMENIKCGNGITREIPQNEKEQPMKVGDEVYVHGYIDEIRQDIVIIRNNGGYFGTFSSEVVDQEPCEDLISRQDAIDGLEYEAELCNRALDDMDIDRKERDRFEWELELVECFIEDIKKLPSKDRPKWTPCDERLPEEPRGNREIENYLTCDEDEHIYIFSWANGWNCCFNSDGSLYKDQEITDIIAWMPLPKAYKESDTDGSN